MKIEIPQKMKNENTNLELDYPTQRKRKRIFVSIAVYFSLLVIFAISGSYKNATVRIDSKLVIYGSYQIRELIKDHITTLNEQYLVDTTKGLDSELTGLIIDFYTQRNFQPAWLQNFATNQDFNTLVNLLDSAAYFGFPYDYFNTERIYMLIGKADEIQNTNDILTQRFHLELTASYSALKFMLFLNHGIIEKDITSIYVAQAENYSEKLNGALNHTNLRNDILSVQPDLVQHQNLLNSLSYYIDLHYSVKYTTPKFIDDNVLARSLYYAGITDSPVFDSTNLKPEALHKLAPEYNSGKNTVLNNPTHGSLVSLLEYRYFQACLNLNRLRNLDHSGDNYLFVNIPEFKLHVVESNKEMEEFNVIVGTTKTPTPTLTSNIEKVVANPYWTVPRSIVNNEMLHKIRKDSTYLKRNGYFVINNQEEKVDESIINWKDVDPLGNKYWIRQKNSQYNALGQVKFIFPNEYSVYLHDTQSKRLFKKDKRTFSHGCIRLENPDKLAQYITDKYYAQSENIDRIISKNEVHEIELSEKVQIHIQYITCSAGHNSEIVFHDDVYKRDENEIRTIFPDLNLI